MEITFIKLNKENLLCKHDASKITDVVINYKIIATINSNPINLLIKLINVRLPFDIQTYNKNDVQIKLNNRTNMLYSINLSENFFDINFYNDNIQNFFKEANLRKRN